MNIFNFFKRNYETGFPPKKLLIKRMKEYHTHYLGKFDQDKLFWGDIPFVIKNVDNKPIRTDYAVLYTFDSNGKLIKYEYWKDENSNGELNPWYKLDEMVKELGKVKYMDISVELFEVTIDNEKFGLIANHEFDCVNAQPSSTISFYEPWDGEYYTQKSGDNNVQDDHAG